MKMAIVTGAARGIGLAGGTAFVCDVSDPVAVDEMVAAVLAVSERIDCLVNNAGVADFCSIEDTSFERWRIVMATNLDGVYLCSRAVLAALKQSRGSIVNIASISGLRASTLRVAMASQRPE